MVHNGRVCWQKETTFGVAPASGAWNPFGYRVTDLRDPGPENAWNRHRGWGGGREAQKLDLIAQDYGGPLGTFKLTDPRIPGFAWGQEPSLPVQIGGSGFYTHTAQPTVNSVAPSISAQVHDQDGGGVGVSRATYQGGIQTEMELSGDEGGEVYFTPTYYWQSDDDGALALCTVTDPTTPTYKHFHGALTAYGQQILRIQSWRFRLVSKATRARYWNQTNPKLAYEYPLEDVDYVFSARAVADGKQFSGFSNRDIRSLLHNGDIGSAVIQAVKTANQDAVTINIGSASDALSLITAPRVRPAAGGRVVYELDFAARASTYQWIDQTATRYFPQ